VAAAQTPLLGAGLTWLLGDQGVLFPKEPGGLNPPGMAQSEEFSPPNNQQQNL
jgi:hypothetical protein